MRRENAWVVQGRERRSGLGGWDGFRTQLGKLYIMFEYSLVVIVY